MFLVLFLSHPFPLPLLSHRYMHYQTRPYVGSSVGGRAATYAPRSTTSANRPINDMRCMPVYEELDPAGDTLPRPQVRRQ